MVCHRPPRACSPWPPPAGLGAMQQQTVTVGDRQCVPRVPRVPCGPGVSVPWGCFLPTPIQVLGARCPQSPRPLPRCWVCPCHRLLPETGFFGGSSSGSVPCESSAEELGSGGCVVCTGGAHTKPSPEEMSKPRATKHPLPQTLSCFCKNLCAGPGCSAAETQEKNPKRGHEGKGARGLGPAGAAGRAGAGRGPRPSGVRTPPAGLCSPTAPSWPLHPWRGAEARWGGLH